METILVALLVFGLLVVFHELGHFAVAKLVGIKVHEFSIGMGPRILKVNGKETEYSIRILPIGGYVKMEGEDEASTDARSFNNKPLLAKMMVIVAGPLMNFVLALLLFFTIFYSIGSATTTVAEVMTGFPAESAGIERGDRIVSIDGDEIDSWDEIVDRISITKEKSLDIEVMRDGEEKIVEIKPIVNEETKQNMIGITPVIEKSFINSIKTSVDRMTFVIKGMLDFFVQLFGGRASSEDVVGPVGIIHLVGEAAKTSVYSVLSLAALISINLGIVNLLPVPALDGGRLVFLGIEAIMGKPMDPEKEGFIHFTGFILLMGLMVFIVYKDILRFF